MKLEYIALYTVTVKPMISPVEKGNEKWFDVVFFEEDTETKKIIPRFHTLVSEVYLKQLGNHFIDCVKDSKNIKFTFTETHYQKFGWQGKKLEDKSEKYID